MSEYLPNLSSYGIMGILVSGGSMKTDIDALKKKYDAKLTALQEEKAAAVKQAKAKNLKLDAREKAQLRKADNHVKILIGGALLAAMKKNNSIELEKVNLLTLVEPLKSERDKKLLSNLTAVIAKK